MFKRMMVTLHNLKARLAVLKKRFPSEKVTTEIIEKEKEAQLLLKKEQLYWGQRSRADQLAKGDTNTVFSHDNYEYEEQYDFEN